MRLAVIVGAIVLAPCVIQAQDVPLTTRLRTWAAGALPQCPDGVLTLEELAGGPAGFTAFVAARRSSDQYCGSQKYLLYSARSQQVLFGSVIPLADDNRPVAARVTAVATELLKKPLTATIAPFPLPDGLKAVAMSSTTPYGPFAYYGYVDASERFLIVGMNGSLTADPATTVSRWLAANASAMRRGNPRAAVEIIELSEFQCPACANAHSKIEPIIQANLSRINYARIDLPLFEHHEWAVPGTLAARALQRVAPLRYWDFVTETFKNQETIGAAPFERHFQQFAARHGLDWAALQKVYNSASERAAVLEQVSRVFQMGIASTPTYIINGRIMGFGPEGSFTLAAIKAALAAAP